MSYNPPEFNWYATYLGGNSSESPHSLVMDQGGDLLLLGTTSSGNFPTSEQAYSRLFKGGTTASHVVEYRMHLQKRHRGMYPKSAVSDQHSS